MQKSIPKDNFNENFIENMIKRAKIYIIDFLICLRYNISKDI